MVMCLGRGADLHMAQLMPLPLTIYYSRRKPDWFYLSGASCPGWSRTKSKRAINGCVCVRACVRACVRLCVYVAFCIVAFYCSCIRTNERDDFVVGLSVSVSLYKIPEVELKSNLKRQV